MSAVTDQLKQDLQALIDENDALTAQNATLTQQLADSDGAKVQADFDVYRADVETFLKSEEASDDEAIDNFLSEHAAATPAPIPPSDDSSSSDTPNAAS